MNNRLTTLRDTPSAVLSPRHRDRSSDLAGSRILFCTLLVLGLLGFSLILFSSLGLAWLQGVVTFLFLWLILCMIGSQ